MLTYRLNRLPSDNPQVLFFLKQLIKRSRKLCPTLIRERTKKRTFKKNRTKIRRNKFRRNNNQNKRLTLYQRQFSRAGMQGENFASFHPHLTQWTFS
jgi:hypothetical protein